MHGHVVDELKADLPHPAVYLADDLGAVAAVKQHALHSIQLRALVDGQGADVVHVDEPAVFHHAAGEQLYAAERAVDGAVVFKNAAYRELTVVIDEAAGHEDAVFADADAAEI